jgi:hypothetical protein
MNKNLELVKVIAENFKEAWELDFPAEFKEINEIEQVEFCNKFPNLYKAIIGIMEFAEVDGEENV